MAVKFISEIPEEMQYEIARKWYEGSTIKELAIAYNLSRYKVIQLVHMPKMEMMYGKRNAKIKKISPQMREDIFAQLDHQIPRKDILNQYNISYIALRYIVNRYYSAYKNKKK